MSGGRSSLRDVCEVRECENAGTGRHAYERILHVPDQLRVLDILGAHALAGKVSRLPSSR
jgi:hypothetical protein